MKNFSDVKNFFINNKKKFILFTLVVSLYLIIYLLLNLNFENQLQDNIKSVTSTHKGSDDIVLIVIDDKSNDAIRFPWERTLYTDLFEYVEKYSNAKVVIFDGMVNDPDKNNPEADKKFYEELKKYKKTIVGFTLNEPLNVSKSEQEIKNNILNSKFNFKIQDLRTEKSSKTNEMIMRGPIEYLQNAQNLGHVHVEADKDGIIREAYPLIEYNNHFYPSLALNAFILTNNIKKLVLSDNFLCTEDNCKTLKMPIFTSKSLFSPQKEIYSTIKWYKLQENEYSYKKYSAIDILKSLENVKQGKEPIIPPSAFKNKYVLIGANANVQNINDVKPTPIARNHAGIDIQATILNNIISNQFMIIRDKKISACIIWFFCLIFLIIIRKSNLRISILTGIILSMLYYLNAYLFASHNNILVPVATPILSILITAIIGYSIRFLTEGEDKAKIQKAMGKYVSTDIMNKIVKNIDNLTTGGKRAEVTVLFVDIRGFTSLSEQLPPEIITSILNDYFSALEPIITEYNGVIYKFIGDAIMAVFGDPIADKDHAKNAVLCANKILSKIKNVQDDWIEQGKPKIDIGVGINTGEVFVGNIGTSDRLEYTVIGDVVNLAHRIEAYNKIYKTSFLISQSTYLKVRNLVDVILIKDVTIRGKAQKINIYEVLRLVK